MGCVQDRSAIKNRFQGEKPSSNPNNKPYISQQHDNTSQKNLRGQKGKETEGSFGSGTSGNEKKSLVDKYSVEVKESSYKTPNIHCYSYQPLIVFNPPTGSSQGGEKDGLEKTQGAMYIPSLTDIHNKLLLTKH